MVGKTKKEQMKCRKRKVTQKDYLNPNSKFQPLTYDQRAITLIALIITIIVMLILVGVAINIAINGGLFDTARKAVKSTKKEQVEEQRLAARVNASLHDEKWYYIAADETQIPIPEGFAPTEIEGENTVNEGIVITDADGNEFVWIPCTKQEYEDASYNSTWPQYNYKTKTWTDEQTLIGAKSIGTYGGFYVGRYEAGVSEKAPFYASKDGDIYEKDTGENSKNTDAYNPVCKKGVQVWNYISQTNAKTVSEKMYKNNTTIGSYLIDSHAWNLICTKIYKDKFGKNIFNSTDWGNYYDNTTTKYENLNVLYAVHSIGDGTTNWDISSTYLKGLIPKEIAPKGEGNNLLELSTGACEDFSVYNIYDMAGNIWEWTTEIGKNNDTSDEKIYADPRGGDFFQNGGTCPVLLCYGQTEVNTVSVRRRI